MTGTKLTPTEAKIWRAAAALISETGVSPKYTAIAERAGTSDKTVGGYADALEQKGYWRRVGVGRAMVLHIVKWPAGIEPRETTGRAGGPGNTRPQYGWEERPAVLPERRADSLFRATCDAPRCGRTFQTRDSSRLKCGECQPRRAAWAPDSAAAEG